jgi:hypothetical protein
MIDKLVNEKTLAAALQSASMYAYRSTRIWVEAAQA